MAKSKTFVCSICEQTLHVSRLSCETLRAAHHLGHGDTWAGLGRLEPARVICDECQAWDDDCGNDLDDDNLDLLTPQDLDPYYLVHFPDECQDRARLDALRQSY